jgi:flavin-dependent dehydrogenase
VLQVDMVIGADGANSRVAKEIDAGEYDYAIAFQERIRIPGEIAVLLLPICNGVEISFPKC